MGSSPVPSTPERTALEAGITRIEPLLAGSGFARLPTNSGTSSGGPFATVVFQRNLLHIGLIVRARDQLGCPNYTIGQGYAGHQDVIAELGHGGKEHLVPGEGLSYAPRGYADAFEALRIDLEELVLPSLRKSEEDFTSAVARAVRRHFSRLGF